MIKEEIKNKDFKNREELEKYLVNLFNFKKSSQEEKNEWPYKSELNFSLRNVIGKELSYKKEKKGIIKDYKFHWHSGKRNIRMVVDGDYSYPLTDSKVKLYNPFYKQEEWISLHPTRKGSKIWTLGFIINSKDYRSLYYRTKEYRDKYETSLNQNQGTSGLTAPIQSENIKNKISSTIFERYGQNWFLERGLHYSAITNTMINQFGVGNLFQSMEWQRENRKNLNFSGKVSCSKLENEVIQNILRRFSFDEPYYYGDDSYQFVFVDENQINTYSVDFYDRKRNIFIEVFGDYWHCNPKKYDPLFYNGTTKKIASEKWLEDQKRLTNIVKISGANYFIVWEDDWYKDKENVLQQISNFLYEKSQG